MKVSAETVSAWRCPDCDRVWDDESAHEGGPLYECGECGQVFNRANSANDNHQCPQCNRFGSKLADVSCPEECESELEEVEALSYEGTLYLPKEDD